MDSDEPALNSDDEPTNLASDPAPSTAEGEEQKPAKKPDPWVRRNFPPPPPLAAGIFTQRPWVGFLLPFIVYMVAGMFEPTPPKAAKLDEKPAAKEDAEPRSKDAKTDGLDADAPEDKSSSDSLDEFAEPAPDSETDNSEMDSAGDDAEISEPSDAEKPAEAHAAHGDKADADKEEEEEAGWFDWMNAPRLLGITYEYYPLVYTIKIALTLAAMAFVLPVYRTFYPVRVSGQAIFVGVFGIFVWIGLWKFQGQANMLEGLGLGDMGARSAFNPWEQIENPLFRYGFLCVRFLGLVAVVPIIEEFFLRGFLIRYLMRDNFWEVPFGYADDFTFGMATVVPMMMHPAELLPAAVWFTLVSWLMVRTRNIWDCIAAHAVTNLLLGIYVVVWDDWALM